MVWQQVSQATFVLTLYPMLTDRQSTDCSMRRRAGSRAHDSHPKCPLGQYLTLACVTRREDAGFLVHSTEQLLFEVAHREKSHYMEYMIWHNTLHEHKPMPVSNPIYTYVSNIFTFLLHDLLTFWKRFCDLYCSRSILLWSEFISLSLIFYHCCTTLPLGQGFETLFLVSCFLFSP